MKIGDVVKIINCELIYSAYREFAEKYHLTNFNMLYSPNNGAVGSIIAIGKHIEGDILLVGVRLVDSNKDIIISVEGLELIESKEMKKLDLKRGMIVELKNGYVGIVINNLIHIIKYKDTCEINDNNHIPISLFTEDLKYKFNSNYNIVKVFDFDHTLLWERKESELVTITINSKGCKFSFKKDMCEKELEVISNLIYDNINK